MRNVHVSRTNMKQNVVIERKGSGRGESVRQAQRPRAAGGRTTSSSFLHSFPKYLFYLAAVTHVTVFSVLRNGKE